MYRKADAREHRHARRKRHRKEYTLLFIVVSILVLFLVFLGYFISFWYYLFVLFLLAQIYITFKLTEPTLTGRTRIRKQTKLARLMRDTRYISPRLRQAVWKKSGGRCVQCKS